MEKSLHSYMEKNVEKMQKNADGIFLDSNVVQSQHFIGISAIMWR